jgi:hypothetical protein
MGLLSLLFFSLSSFGQSSCLPVYTALQTVESSDVPFEHRLIGNGPDGPHETRIFFGGAVENSSLKMKVQFDPTFNGVSIPYNVFAVLVVADGETVAWYDFTRGCRSPPISFFPGRVIELPPVKLLGSQPQKLQIMVWGKL